MKFLKSIKKGQLLLSLIVGLIVALMILLILLCAWFLPTFGPVTIWQVLANMFEPISLLARSQKQIVQGCVAIAVMVFLVVTISQCLFVRRYRAAFNGRGALLVNYIYGVVVLLSLYAAYIELDWTFDLKREWHAMQNPSHLFRDEYEVVDPSHVSFPDKKYNLIVLVAESFEESFVDGTAFCTNVIPHLTEWRAQHETFGLMEVVHGCDHSICALFGMSYGIPRFQLFDNPFCVSFVSYPETHVPSAWEVWLKNGYNCKFMKGGSLEFACTDKVFKAVPDVVTHDYLTYNTDGDYLKEPDKHPFGVHDEVVIGKYLRQETLELANDNKPFVLIAWTLDTHGPFGWRSSLQPPLHTNLMAHAALKTDQLLGDYLNWVDQQSFRSNTVVVVVGDHIVHGRVVDLPQNMRHPYNAISMACRGSIPRQVHPFAAFDFAPTFLELTGAKLEKGRFGMGTSLISGEKTLLERIGKERYEEEIRACGADYRRIVFGW